MSGILDSKSRVLDAIVTFEGRSQLSQGGLDVKYVSFSDAGTFYKADVASGSQDAADRIYFEACNLPQDQVTFQADTSGHVLPFANGSGIQVMGGQLVSYSLSSVVGSRLSGSTQTATLLKGPEFAETAQTLMGSTSENFVNLHLLSTRDVLFEDEGFGVGTSDVTFTINNNGPISDPTMFTANVNQLDSLFSDVRMSNVPNFKFLPPLNKTVDKSVDKTDFTQTTKHQLGHYKPWGRPHVFGLSKAQLDLELQHYDLLKCSRTVSFDPTSTENHLVAQVFEVNYNVMNKLDVIDYPVPGSTNRYFFVGKVLTDDNGANTFVHVFTLVFG